ncbi:uncharacterized protein LOC127155457 [Labeo rohita]|uniref:uncharacterized protein LOC127155457 n=1 Tax=Labeo rohita TaxID=84645 RepID=UPI0021E34017|nr:uncharacterized protein LOC127155457 [Labeo rohita]
MADSAERQNTASLEDKLHKINEIIKQSTVMEEGTLPRYRLKPRTDSADNYPSYRKITFGERERDNNKTHKTILMVGETGAGKTTLINAMVNYILRIEKNDKVWFEITDDNSDEHRSLVQSQTSRITIYDLNLQDRKIYLTIIDTPGYGDTHDIQNDKEIAMSLLNLSRCNDWVHEIHTVCLAIKATENRLSDRQQYIFDAVQSLFGRDIAENIVLLFTHSCLCPKNALMAVKEAKVKCAVNDKNQPVFFTFNNCHSEAADQKDENMENYAWKLSNEGMKGLFNFLDNIKPKTLKMTQNVLQQQKQLEANIFNLQSRVQEMELKQNELTQTQEALEKNKEDVRNNKNFEYEVEVTYKEKIPIDPKMWRLTKKATCCTICEENCHYPGCWWADDISWCSVMKDDYCTVCTNKCHYSRHVKEAKIYEAKKEKKTRTYEELKNKYFGEICAGKSLVKKLEEELQELEIKKTQLVNEAFDCVVNLEMTALNPDSLLILLHVDFLTEKLREIKMFEKAKILEDIKRRAGGHKKGALGYFTRLVKK